MSLISCNVKCNCTVAAVLAGLIIGIITAFLQITGIITVTSFFLLASLGIAIAYLGILLLSASLASRSEQCMCFCESLNTLLIGILGTILLALVLIAFGITATSVISAILVGLLLFFLTLAIAGSACFVKCLVNCKG